MRFKEQSGLGLPDASLDFSCRIFLRGAMLCQLLQLGCAVGRRVPGQHRLEHPRRDQIGKSAVRSGRVRIFVQRQAEVTDRLGPGSLDDVLARTHQLDDDERKIGEAQRIGLAAPG